jgi:hypothetical protein
MKIQKKRKLTAQDKTSRTARGKPPVALVGGQNMHSAPKGDVPKMRALPKVPLKLVMPTNPALSPKGAKKRVEVTVVRRHSAEFRPVSADQARYSQLESALKAASTKLDQIQVDMAALAQAAKLLADMPRTKKDAGKRDVTVPDALAGKALMSMKAVEK